MATTFYNSDHHYNYICFIGKGLYYIFCLFHFFVQKVFFGLDTVFFKTFLFDTFADKMMIVQQILAYFIFHVTHGQQ